MYVLGKQGVRQAANDIVNDIVSGVELRYDACRVCAEAMSFIKEMWRIRFSPRRF